jgi:hypothetical protein
MFGKLLNLWKFLVDEALDRRRILLARSIIRLLACQLQSMHVVVERSPITSSPYRLESKCANRSQGRNVVSSPASSGSESTRSMSTCRPSARSQPPAHQAPSWYQSRCSHAHESTRAIDKSYFDLKPRILITEVDPMFRTVFPEFKLCCRAQLQRFGAAPVSALSRRSDSGSSPHRRFPIGTPPRVCNSPKTGVDARGCRRRNTRSIPRAVRASGSTP